MPSEGYCDMCDTHSWRLFRCYENILAAPPLNLCEKCEKEWDMKIETYTCDITKCKKTLDKFKKEHEPITIQVIFVTEQTEGYPSKPHLCSEKLNICPDCMARVLEGNYIFGAGAQGDNDYYFRDSK